MLLNLDLASTAFYQHGPLVKVVLDFFGCGSVNEWAQYCSTPTHMLKLERFLKGVNIDITYRASGRLKYKIFSISKKSAAATTILMSGDAAAETAASSAGKGKKAATAGGKGREISIAHFFKTVS